MYFETYKYIHRPDEGDFNDIDVLELKYTTIDSILTKTIIHDSLKHKYLVFDSRDDMLAFIDETPLEFRCFHEVIFGQKKQKLKFDIDASEESINELIIEDNDSDDDYDINLIPHADLEFDSDIQNLLDDIIVEQKIDKTIVDPHNQFDIKCRKVLDIIRKSIRDTFLVNYRRELPDENLIICESVALPDVAIKKCSFHIIIDKFYVSDNKQAQEFTRKMTSFLPNNILPFLDRGVNKSLQNFRIIGCRKHDSWRIKTLRSAHRIDQTLITNIDDCDELPNLALISRAKTEVNDTKIGADDMHSVLQICHENGILDDHRFKNNKNGLFIFTRLRSSFCEFCDRDHDNDNTMIVSILRDGPMIKLFKSCRRDITRSTFIGEFISGVAPIDKYPRREDEHNKIAQTKPITDWAEKHVIKAIKQLNSGVELFPKITLFDDLGPANKNVYNEPQLRSFELSRTLCVKAHMKMGKTNKLIEYLNRYFAPGLRDPIIRFVSFRQTFSGNIKERFKDFELYSDSKGQLLHNRLIIQEESMHRLQMWEGIDAPDLLILDECESIFEQFDSGLFKHFNVSFAIFEWMLKFSKHVVCMDANLSDRTFRIIEKIRNLDGIMYHYNTFQNATDDQYFITADRLRWLGMLHAAIENDEKIVVPTSSLNIGETLRDSLKKKFPNKNIKFYSRNTSSEEKRVHLGNVDLYWSQYDVLIYTPTITAGVSFEVAHFAKIFGYFTDASCNAETCIQMIGRTRNVELHQYYICINAIGGNLPMTIPGIKSHIQRKRSDLLKGYDNSFLSFEYTELGEAKFHTSSYLDIWAENTRIRNISKNQFIKRFIHIVSLCGAKINHLDDTVFTEGTGSPIMIEGELNADLADIKVSFEATRIEIKAEAIKNIADARDLNDADVEEIQNLIVAQKDISSEQRYAYEKYRIRQHYQYPSDLHIDDKFITKYGDHQARTVYKNLMRISNAPTIEEALKKIQDEERANYVYVMSLDESSQHADINRKYVFERHRIALGMLKACGWNNIHDPKYIIQMILAENLRMSEKLILDDTTFICTEFQIKLPNLQNIYRNRAHDDLYIANMLDFINRVLKAMYGVIISSLRDEKDMYHLQMNKLFAFDANNRPIIRAKK